MLRDLLQLEQGVRIELKGGYEGPLLPESLRQEAIALVARESSTLLPLKKSLEVALGGGQFLKAALWTRHGYFVGEGSHADSRRRFAVPFGGDAGLILLLRMW